MFKLSGLKFSRAKIDNCNGMKLPGWMRSVELSSQHPYALSFQGNIHACGRGIDGVPVAGFVWTTSYAVRSDVLDSTVSPIFAMQQNC